MSSASRRKPLSLISVHALADILTAAGLSRHQQIALLRSERVSVDGKPTRNPLEPVDLLAGEVCVDGARLADLATCRYLLLFKPYRVLCAFTDPEGRATLADYVAEPDVYAVGRLDYDSEGLMLLTDDGWLNHRLAHPEYDHPKTYLAQVERVPDEAALRELARGVIVKGQRTLPAEVTLLTEAPALPERPTPVRYRANVPTAWLRLVLREGKKRQVRHMTAAVGYPTLRLVRVAIGPLTVGSLEPGEWRHLTHDELLTLRASVQPRGRRRS
ncbi:MAG: pseudouridine synthase [Anaerolineae bacterium]|jgi:23S rRNA pseudouridine2457 synthase